MAAPFQSLRGHFLLDGGKLQGSPFQRAVVLICQHDPEGAFGLMLNRPTGGKVGDAIVANLPESIKEQPLFIGGPVEPGALSFLHSDAFVPHANVMMNLNLGHSIESLVDLGESYSTTQKIRLFGGYAGWSPGQLDQEMARRDWLALPASLEWIFRPKPEELWREILRQQEDKNLRLLADAPENISWN